MNTWHTSGGGNHRNGLAKVSVNVKSSSPKTIEAEGSVIASPVFDNNGTAYIADRAGYLQAVSSKNETLWKVDYREGFHASPALNEDGSILYTASVEGKVIAVRASDGSPIWKEKVVQTKDPRILADLLFLPKGNIVITSTWEEEVIALDGTAGKKKYSWNVGLTPVSASAASSIEEIYYVQAKFSWDNPKQNGMHLIKVVSDRTSTKDIYSYHSPDDAGKEMWTSAAPVVNDKHERVYYISNIMEEGILHCIDPHYGKELWQKKYSRQIQATPCMTPNGNIVVGDMFGNVTAYDVEGNQTYRYKTGAMFILGSPVCDSNGVVFVGDNEGGVHFIQPDGAGEKLFEAERSIEGRLSISPDGRLFVPCMDGNVYVVG